MEYKYNPADYVLCEYMTAFCRVYEEKNRLYMGIHVMMTNPPSRFMTKFFQK